MKSKYIIVVLCIVMASSIARGQSEADISALADFLQPEKITALQAQPARYAQMAYLNRHGYHVSNLGNKPSEEYPDVSAVTPIYPNLPPITLELAQSGELNLMGYKIDSSENADTVYHFEGTSMVLVILATNTVLKRANLVEE